ncbi:MAG: TatD family hydrolase [Patescibacteria group bacterium]
MLFDSHTHLHFKDFDEDRDAVLARCRAEGVSMLNVGTDAADSQKAVALGRSAGNGVYASSGIHPNEVSPEADFETVALLARDENVVAIGETGLDYFRTTEKSKQELQKEFFIKHIQLAHEVGKPLIIHCRNAHPDLLQLLTTYHSLLSKGGVMHFFGGEGAGENAEAYRAMGFYLSFAGVVTFSNYAYAEELKRIPLERMLIETDAPFVAPVPYRGKRNEPPFVRFVAEKIAEIKGVRYEEVAEQTAVNARRLFDVE